MQPIGSHCCEVMYFGCFGFRGELGFLNCDDVCTCNDDVYMCNDLIDKFMSAYRCGHRMERALLRVYNNVVPMVGKGNGSYLGLLDLSAAFDTIDHDTLFVILEKYVEITGSPIQLLKSYFSDRSRRVHIDHGMSEVVNLVCEVPQSLLYAS